MPNYRRSKLHGGTYFFTVVSYRRQKILCDNPIRNALRDAINSTRLKYPFRIEAWVLLPDHLHCIWTLPEHDADYMKRWSLIKRKVSIVCSAQYKNSAWLSISSKKHRESTIWQRRYWEHRIRDQDDFNLHVEYIHNNPVKHGWCEQAIDWPYSTLYRW